MKTMKCIDKWVDDMVSMPSSSKEQNEALKEQLMRKELSLDQCRISIKNEQIVSRIVIDDARAFLGYFTIEDLTQQECDEIMIEILAQLDRSREWRIDLYSDKVHYDVIHQTLQRYLSIEILRESYVKMTAPQALDGFTFQSAHRMEKEGLLELMMRASDSTLDIMLQREQQNGLRASVEERMQDLFDNEASDELFQVLLLQERPVGFVAVNALVDTIGGIGYIGVDPVWQGNHYGAILLKKALDMSYHHGITKLIGDIDVHNFAIRGNLHACGFHLDCKQSIFLLDAVNKTVDKS